MIPFCLDGETGTCEYGRNNMNHHQKTGSATALCALLVCLATLVGCAGEPEVFTTDLTRQSGVYVVGYTADTELRRAFEDRLVSDLGVRGIAAFASYEDLPDLAASTPEDVVRGANRRDAVGVVLVNQASADASQSPVQNPARVTPLHPDIQTFYRLSRDEMRDTQDGRPVFAEVNLFLVDGASTRLFWSGTTWSFQPGDRDRAISQVSEAIAEQMAAARAQLSSGS